MAENQTASEDSGQQQQDQQANNQQSQQQDSSPDQESSSDSITPNPRSKTLTMRNSLTCIKVPRAMSSTSSSAEGTNQKTTGSGKHHHHNHNHRHNHNSTSSGHNIIHRTTSESLRLGSGHAGGAGSGNLTNSTSNSSSVREGSSSVATTTTKNSNSTTSNHSHSMSSSSSQSYSHSSHPHSHPHLPNSGGGPMQRKPKTSSFQITSVTVGNKISSDNGDDSADDLDESHTDDNSRITDLENETPSVSEDTFSKEDVFFANNALSTTAPVIPTSAQYGLVVVDPIGSSVGQTIQNVQVNVADNIINVVSAVGNKKKPEVKETQHRSERFKVVKIESTEPFRRGRWVCMDYLDHSGNQTVNKDVNSKNNNSGSTGQAASGVSSLASGEETPKGVTQTNIILTNDSSAAAATGGIENHIDAAAQLAADGNLNIYRSESMTTSAVTRQNANQTTVHGQTVGGSLNIQPQPTQQNQSQLPNKFQGHLYEGNGGHGQTMPLAATEFQQHQAAQNNQPPQVNGNETTSVAGQSQPASFFANQFNTSSAAGGGSSSAQPTFQPQQVTPAHGATLPANIHMLNGADNAPVFPAASFAPASEGGVAPSATTLPQQQQQPAFATQTSASAGPQTYAGAAISGAVYADSVNQQQATDSINPTQNLEQSDSNAATPPGGGSGQQPQSQPQQQFQSLHSNPVAGQTMPIINQMNYDIQGQQQPTQQAAATNNTPATISDPTAIASTIQQQQQIDTNNFANNTNNNNNAAVASSTTTNNASEGSNASANSNTNGVGGGSGSGGGSGPSSSVSQPPQAPSTSSSLSVAGSVQGSTSGGSGATASTTGSTTDENQLHLISETETESASGTSAVAIDNKIEQAMDLVKSHLMIAVREEVEVLKEKISELMDKINQLEVENTILKANMSQETLHQLQIQAQLQIAGTAGTNNMITQAPPAPTQQTPSQPPQQPPQSTPTPTPTPPQPQQQAATQQTPPASQQAPASADAATAATAAATPANSTNGPLS